MTTSPSLSSFLSRWSGSSAAERAAEERAGIIRWLRPDYQNPKGTATQQPLIADEKPKTAPTPAKKETRKKQPWPKPLKDQLQAVRAALAQQAAAVTPDQLARTFSGAKTDRVSELLESLAALGQAREVEEGRFVG